MSEISKYTVKLREVFLFLSHIRFAKIKKNDNVLIYGISRGGTTLLAETLTVLFRARLVWEPFFVYRSVSLDVLNPFSTEAYQSLDLGWSPHTASADDPELNTYFDKLFSLRIRNIRYLRYTDYKTFKKSEHTIFKFCFANYMYPYFQKRYNSKAVILLRHPFAIAASSLKFGDNFSWHKKNYNIWRYIDSKKSEGFFDFYNDKYELIVSPFTLLVFQAVSQFSYLINNMDKSNTTIVFYEDIVVDPKLVYENLQDFFETSLNYSEFMKSVKKESFSSQKGHTKTDAAEQLSKWKAKCTEEDINRALKIFKVFDFDLYSDDIMPNKAKAQI